MPKMGLFYTNSGLGQEAAISYIQERMSGLGIDIQKIKSCIENSFSKYDLLVFGVASWQDGALEDDWEDYIKNLNEENLLTKSVAIFGLGDTQVYCKNFLDAMQIIYKKILTSGSTVVGSWPNDGYSFEAVQSLLFRKDKKNDFKDKAIDQYIEFSTPYFSK